MTECGMSPARFLSDSPEHTLFARIQATVANTPASTIGTRARIFAALAVASTLAAAVTLTASRIVYHRYAPGLGVPASSGSYLTIVLLLLVANMVAATLIATWRGLRGFGSGVMSLYVVSALVAPIYAALVIVSPAHADEAAAAGVAISPWGVRCAVISAIIGLVVLASFTLALRGSVPVASRLRGAAIGAAAGAWAGLGVFVFCPSDEFQHLLLGHVLPIVAFTLLGTVAIPRALRL
jgi:hypothetical protein